MSKTKRRPRILKPISFYPHKPKDALKALMSVDYKEFLRRWRMWKKKVTNT